MELSTEYLRGIELFNREQYFECHEALESLWLRSDGIEREFLHAMIQIAASLHHLQRGNLIGAASIYQRARQRLITMPEVVMRLDTKVFAEEMEAFFSTVNKSGTSRPFLPQIHLND
jgi:uncharacterized protein